ncbi:MAG: sn-glycerol-1-phosphate dehydrogenase [Clostridia bacterium]|nr:sn-glycerol-1-phosphate dehydrogenase [Clostridia bacterium]
MTVSELLRGISQCACGRSHTCPIHDVVIGAGVLSELPRLTEGYRHILLVADENTYAVAGGEVRTLLGMRVADELLYHTEPGQVLVPNEKAIAQMKARVTSETDLILGVGSGVINDLCKHVSFVSGLPYYIVATAPSMDGYASVGAALILDGMKVTLSAAVPRAIIADTNVLCAAPAEMIAAGYGDIIGKYSCLSDWKLANLLFDEYLCPTVLDATYEAVEKTVRLTDGLASRSPETIGALMEALVAVGILMAYVGNSRPASGSEHHLSHYFEIVGIVRHEPYLPHGVDVFHSAVETARLREQLANMEAPVPAPRLLDRAAYEREITRIYGSVAPEVLALQERLGWYTDEAVTRRHAAYCEKWDEVRRLLANGPTADELLDLLTRAGLRHDDFIALYGEEKIADARFFAKDLKDRYTVLWLYDDLLGRTRQK